jgi:hypothetical protein
MKDWPMAQLKDLQWDRLLGLQSGSRSAEQLENRSVSLKVLRTGQP